MEVWICRKEWRVPENTGNEKGISTLTTSVQDCTGGNSQCHEATKQTDGIKIGKKELKLSLLLCCICSEDGDHSQQSDVDIPGVWPSL